MSQMSSMSVDSSRKPQSISETSYSNSHSEMHDQTHSYSTDHVINNNDEDWDNVAFGGTSQASTARPNTSMDTSYRNNNSGEFRGGRGGGGGTRGRGGMDRGGGGDRTCYKCGESGHMSRECTKPGGDSYRGGRGGGRGGAGGGGDRSCYKCGESGHISRDCTKPGDAGSRGGRDGYDRGRGGFDRGRGGNDRGRGGGRDSNYNRQSYTNGSGGGGGVTNSNDDDWDAPASDSTSAPPIVATNSFRSVATPQHVPSAAQTPKPMEDWTMKCPLCQLRQCDKIDLVLPKHRVTQTTGMHHRVLIIIIIIIIETQIKVIIVALLQTPTMKIGMPHRRPILTQHHPYKITQLDLIVRLERLNTRQITLAKIDHITQLERPNIRPTRVVLIMQRARHNIQVLIIINQQLLIHNRQMMKTGMLSQRQPDPILNYRQ